MPQNQQGAPILHARDTWNSAIADSPSPEIADRSDGGTDRRPRAFVFDVFAEDDGGDGEHWQNGDAELPPPRQVLGKAGHFPSLNCNTASGSTRI